MDQGLGDRLFNFAVRVIKYCQKLEGSVEFKVIRNQLTKSASSSGANYEESQAASSKADFKNKMSISLREMRESNYWLRICVELNLGDQNNCKDLVNESIELKKILGSIATKVSKT